MSRPWVLVFLLMLMVFTSQFEWKQQIGNEIEASQIRLQKEQYSSKREEVAKEKIILSQEKNIQKLNDLVRSLRKELLHCRSESQVVNMTGIRLAEHYIETERLPVFGD